MPKDYQSYSKEELIRELDKLKKQKKYGLVWEDKPEDVVELCKTKLPVLKEVKSKEIITDKDKPINILIEGDNYHALSVLNYTHEKKIDVIYIDPPYNTGNKDFIYNDKYVDMEDGYRHSKWLSFMESRLKLARSLLKHTGVIFISIDDNEVAQLKILCDTIFGEQNLIADFIWNSTKSITNPALVSIAHTYNLTYAKDKSVYDLKHRKNFKLPAILEGFNNPDNDPRGPWKADPFEAGGTRPNQMYPITNPITKEVFHPNKGNCWKNDLNKFKELLADNRIVFGKDGKGRPQRKRFIWEAKERGLTSNTWWDDIGTTTNGTMELKNILGDKLFNNPKPVSLIRKILLLASQRDSTVLDFMAGSGTTGHAVLELNKEGGGNRQFILCTNNENNICTDVCYPRIEKAIQGYKNLKGEKVEGLGGNLKYFKTDFVDAEPTDKNKKKLTDEATEMLCICEGTFTSVVDSKQYKVYRNGNHFTGIIFDQLAIPAFKKAIKKIGPIRVDNGKDNNNSRKSQSPASDDSNGVNKFSVYVFSLGDDTFDEEFEDMKQKVKLSPIPEAILRVYRRIFK
ncbi:MAG: site-specific DNA-methyltransferase [Planctomycetes bacterium]|nr:site-specific DNA-methyltransferase [Planctomycetota bacterium]